MRLVTAVGEDAAAADAAATSVYTNITTVVTVPALCCGMTAAVHNVTAAVTVPALCCGMTVAVHDVTAAVTVPALCCGMAAAVHNITAAVALLLLRPVTCMHSCLVKERVTAAAVAPAQVRLLLCVHMWL